MKPRQFSADELDHLMDTESPVHEAFYVPPESPLLRLLLQVERGTLSRLMTEHRYQRGEVIFWEGDTGDAMYLIRSGQVLVFKGDLESATILGYRGPGEIIGEMALLEGQPRSATNVALDQVRAFRMNRGQFQELVSTHPEIGMSIMSSLSARLRVADDIRASALEGGKELVHQVKRLLSEREELLALQRIRQETSDLIVHDLRNPLSIILGVLNMLNMVLPEEIVHENHELLDLAGTACERMQRLVDSLLDVAKLETGEMPLTLARVNLKPVLEDTVYRQSVGAHARGIGIRTDIPDNLRPIVVDVEKLERVIINLLDNAVKYTPPNEEIVVAVDETPEEVRVRVIDTGPGIPPEERERIFERFAQVAGSKASRRGFGLGLTFCRLTVEAHGGRIWAEAGPDDRGSQFVFTLPAASVE